MKIYRFLILALLIASPLISEASDLATACSPGELGQKAGDAPGDIEALVVSGAIDIRDIIFIREKMTSLSVLDLRDCRIEAYQSDKPVWMGHRIFNADILPAYSLAETKITDIVLPATLKDIDDGAFLASSLKNISFPAKLNKIGNWAFAETSITGISLPQAASVGEGIFLNCRELKTADMSALDLASLPPSTFQGTSSLEKVTLPKNLKYIGDCAFMGSGLREIGIPDAVTGRFSLAGMPNLSEADLSNTRLGHGALYHCTAMRAVSGMPAEIGSYALAGCGSLNSVKAASEASLLGDYALADSGLHQVVLSGSIASLGEGTFSGMPNLSSIDAKSLGSRIPAIDAGTLAGITPENIGLYVADNTGDLWRAHPQWGRFNIKEGVSVVISTVTSDNIDITLSGDILRATSSENISSILVYDESGMLICSSTPGTTSAELTIPSGKNILVVRTATASFAETRKFIRR